MPGRALDRAGYFEATPTVWGIKKYDSGAIGVSILFGILSEWNGEDWSSWAEYEAHEIYGNFFIVKKDGGLNDTQVEALCKALNWSGNLQDFSDENAQFSDCVITVGEEQYNGQNRLKVKWANPIGWAPNPSISNIDDGEIGTLQKRFGSQLRAIAGNVKRNGQAPPKRSDAAPVPEPATGDSIPF